MFIISLFSCVVLVGAGGKPAETDQYCMDPRTMRKHAAYTEWADAYSCTRHRCQPGGRNLAIYTVGCKRVEAPESAIECEEVVEDTNMQFPYCCTRLRCLVVVRGEVWTRVLGQPWETLPAAPWSHMYKMKKPPPVDGSFLPKGGLAAGPVYELAEDKTTADRRAGEKECDKPVVRAQAPPATPDIVIALTTNSDKTLKDDIQSKFLPQMDDRNDAPNDIDAEEMPTITEKVPEIMSEEHIFIPDKKTAREHKLFPDVPSEELPSVPNYRGVKESRPLKLVSVDDSSDEGYKVNKKPKKSRAWSRIPQEQWNSNPSTRSQSRLADEFEKEHDSGSKNPHEDSEEKPEEKPASLQHLVNAIGTRMRDIENVVQQMSEKVQPPMGSIEQYKLRAERSMPHANKELAAEIEALGQPKIPNTSKYNRFPPQQGTSTYLRGRVDTTTEPPIFVNSMSGYFSDPSNNLLRRAMRPSRPTEPQETYMVPISTDHKKPQDTDDESELKHKKHTHKKKKSKHGKKKHHREEREKKKFLKLPEPEKNTVSVEDSNDIGTGREMVEPHRSTSQQEAKAMLTNRPMAYEPIQPPMMYQPIAVHSQMKNLTILTNQPMVNDGRKDCLLSPTHRLMNPMEHYRPEPNLAMPSNKLIEDYIPMPTQPPMKYRPMVVSQAKYIPIPTNQPMVNHGRLNYLLIPTHRLMNHLAELRAKLNNLLIPFNKPMEDYIPTQTQPPMKYRPMVVHSEAKNRAILTNQPMINHGWLNYLLIPTHRPMNPMEDHRLEPKYLPVPSNESMGDYTPMIQRPMAKYVPIQTHRLTGYLSTSRPIKDDLRLMTNQPTKYRSASGNNPSVENYLPLATDRPMDYQEYQPMTYLSTSRPIKDGLQLMINQPTNYRSVNDPSVENYLPLATDRPMDYQGYRPMTYLSTPRPIKDDLQLMINQPTNYRSVNDPSIENYLPLATHRPIDYRPMTYLSTSGPNKDDLQLMINQPTNYRSVNDPSVEKYLPLATDRLMDYQGHRSMTYTSTFRPIKADLQLMINQPTNYRSVNDPSVQKYLPLETRRQMDYQSMIFDDSFESYLQYLPLATRRPVDYQSMITNDLVENNFLLATHRPMDNQSMIKDDSVENNLSLTYRKNNQPMDSLEDDWSTNEQLETHGSVSNSVLTNRPMNNRLTNIELVTPGSVRNLSVLNNRSMNNRLTNRHLVTHGSDINITVLTNQPIKNRSAKERLETHGLIDNSVLTYRPMNNRSTNKQFETHGSVGNLSVLTQLSIDNLATNKQLVTHGAVGNLSALTNRPMNNRLTNKQSAHGLVGHRSGLTERPKPKYRPVLPTPYHKMHKYQLSYLMSASKKSKILSDMRRHKNNRYKHL